MKLSEVADRTCAMAGGVHEIESVVPRALKDMPDLVHDGAREIALLTVVARQQEFEFAPVMQALEALSKLKDWSHNFLVAHNVELGGLPKQTIFDWRDSPHPRYASFQDFYRRELEPTWGSWAELQQTWAKVVAGEISEDEGRRTVLGTAKGGQSGNKNASKNEGSITTFVSKPSIGRGRVYILARLDRDGHAELAAKVRAKKMSANAAAEEMGWRKKLTPYEHVLKWLPKLTAKERRSVHQKTKPHA